MRAHYVLVVVLLMSIASSVRADAPEPESPEVVAYDSHSFGEAGSVQYDYEVDFTASPEGAELTLASGGNVNGSVELLVVRDGIAAPLALHMLSGSEQAVTERVVVPGDALVTLRIVATANGPGDINWSMTKEREELKLVEDNHRRRDRDHCSTGSGESGLMMLIAAMALLGVTLRLARGSRTKA